MEMKDGWRDARQIDNKTSWQGELFIRNLYFRSPKVRSGRGRGRYL